MNDATQPAGVRASGQVSPTVLVAVPDYYSEHYHFERYPAKVAGRPGYFCVWSREVDRPNPEHVTWSPEIVALVSRDYQNDAWHAERAEKASRPELQVGEVVNLGGLLVTVPRRAAEYVDGVPCPVLESH